MNRLWRLLLALYPEAFRSEYGGQMLDTLARRYRQARKLGRRSAARFLLLNTADLVRGALLEHRGPGTGSPARRSSRAFLLDELATEARLAVRRFVRTPAFTVGALLLLTIGIGANSTIYAVLHAVVLRPLPYAEPDRLVQVWESNRDQSADLFAFSYPNYLDQRDQNRSLTHLAAYDDATYNLTGDGEAISVAAGRVTHDLLPTLGIEPLLGRGFVPEDVVPGPTQETVLLSHRMWRTRFGERSDVLGERLNISGQPHTIVGVLPSRTGWLDTWDLVTPLDPHFNDHRGDHRLNVVGRLRPGVEMEAAETDLEAVAARLADSYPATNTGFGVRVIPLHQATVGSEVRTTLYTLMGAVGFVLLIAASNLANLLLARSTARRHELAVGLALGSSRARLLRQLLTESTMLALVGAAAGLVVAQLALSGIRSIEVASVPRLDEVSIDGSIVLFTVLLAIVTGLFAGLVPAWQATRGDLAATLQSAGRGKAGARDAQRTRSLLLATEVAVSVVLLVGAGLLMRSFWGVSQVDPGLRTEGILTTGLNLPADHFRRAETDSDAGAEVDREADRARRVGFYRELQSEIEALPEVGQAGFISGMPFGGGATSMSVRIEGQPHERGAAPQGFWRIISPAYFDTLDIPLLEGRLFDERDSWRNPGKVIVSRHMAERFWPGESAVGKRFFPWEREEQPVEIVGVVGDVRERDLGLDSEDIIYLPLDEFLHWSPMYLLVRTTTEPDSVVPTLRRALARLEPDLALIDPEPLGDVIGRTLAPRRLSALLLLAFAAIASALAAIGIYGVLAYSVARRAPEIGVRITMGASPRRLRGMVLAQAMGPVVLGGLIGLVAATLLAKLLDGLLFGVTSTDPATFLLAPAVLGVIGLLAATLPALRASRLDVIEALRAD